MRGLIILCLVAVACAQYSYQPNQVSHVDSVPSSLQSGAVLSGPVAAPASVSAAPAVYQKEFYSYTASESDFGSDGGSNLANALNKKVRVVFIKGPENTGIENAALQLAQQAGDERTAIYVLQKQADANALAQQLQNLRSQSQNRPEVHFVKYRTQQDAQNAQNAIQSQYDQLPGSTQSHNGGNAPVLNFASASQALRTPTAQAPSNAYLPSSVFRLRLRK